MYLDDNILRRMAMSGELGPQDFPPTQNALADLMMPRPRNDIAPIAMNSMRFENGPDEGRTVPLDFRQQQMGQQPQPSRKIKLYGSGNGQTVDLGEEDLGGRPQLDLTRAPIDIPGVGKAFYSKDGRGAYVMQNGEPAARVMLGYDDAASRARTKSNVDLQKERQQIAQSQASVEHTAEQIRASKMQNPDMNLGVPGVGGEGLLSSLDPGTAGLVKAYAEGKMAFPQGAAMRSPRMMQLMSLVSQYDPTFDATDYNARNKTLSGFTAGKQGDAVRAVNQAIAHAGSLNDSIDKLDNFNGIATPLNAPVNAVEQLFGDSRQGNFKQNALALSSELRKVFAGSGGGSLSELQSWESGLPLNASKEQQKAYLGKGLELLNGAIGALDSQFKRGMGPRADVMQIIDPKAKATLDKLIGWGSASMPDQAKLDGAKLTPGTVSKGHVYIGGDPASESSWKKIGGG